MKVVLDIGAHHGQSIETALSPKYEFKRIVAFEPVPANADYVQKTVQQPARRGLRVPALESDHRGEDLCHLFSQAPHQA